LTALKECGRERPCIGTYGDQRMEPPRRRLAKMGEGTGH